LSYTERFRPGFHFTCRFGWLNDPNGLVFYEGEYHLFFQHNPDGTEWGNMTWGHAVSKDLIHWQQLSNAIEPYNGSMIFSGSAAVDEHNSAGLQQGSWKTMVALFTHATTPSGQAMAFSCNRGRSWKLFEGGRHMIPNQGLDPLERDPRLFWYEPCRRWIMVLWVKPGTVRFFQSDDLKVWSMVSDFTAADFFECPDLFELPVRENPDIKKWILHDAAFRYWIGSFDGIAFRPKGGPFTGDHGQAFYAAQTWNNVPERKIQIAWMRGGIYPGMPFNQQLSFPCELLLGHVAGEVRILRKPVHELEFLHNDLLFDGGLILAGINNALPGIKGDLFDIRCRFMRSSATALLFKLYDQEIRYFFKEGILSAFGCRAPLNPVNDQIELQLLVDRTSLEIFGNEGEVSLSNCFVPENTSTDFQLLTEGGKVEVISLKVHKLKSIWNT
jgi:fructan beta-fructosidase